MHVTVSSTFHHLLRPEIDALVRAGFEGVECHDVEVHVKARTTKRRWYVVRRGDGSSYRFRHRASALRYLDRTADDDAVLERWVGPAPRAAHFSARTYDGVPGMARVQRGAAYLVTVSMPARPDRLRRYPLEHRYPGLKTAPVFRFDTWQENLLAFAAHEARHVEQFRRGLKRSEIDAERWALARLDRWRDAERSVGDDDGVADELSLFDLDHAEGVVGLAPPVGR